MTGERHPPLAHSSLARLRSCPCPVLSPVAVPSAGKKDRRPCSVYNQPAIACLPAGEGEPTVPVRLCWSEASQGCGAAGCSRKAKQGRGRKAKAKARRVRASTSILSACQASFSFAKRALVCQSDDTVGGLA